jgi:hypothetical protein
MKQLLTYLFFVLSTVAGLSQTDTTSLDKTRSETTDEYFLKSANKKRREELACRRNYFGISSGINNPSGLAGIMVTRGIDYKNSITGGLGIGVWGVKTNLLYRRVLKGCTQQGTELYGGFSRSSSTRGSISIEATDSNNELRTYTVDLNEAYTFDFGVIFNLRLGRAGRAEFFIGGEASLSDEPYTNTTKNYKLSREAKTILNIMKPGGLTLGLTLSFGGAS